MKFHHVAITVKDLLISVKFYEDIFGFSEIKRFRRDEMGLTIVFLQGENVIIELGQFDELNDNIIKNKSFIGIRHISFTDDNIKSIYDSFIAKGIMCKEIKTGASGGIYFFISDPDGNQIEIYKPAII